MCGKVSLIQWSKKSKVDNLYRGSKRSRSLQNRYYNTPLVHWTATYMRVNMKALARDQIILLGEQRHIGVNNLPKVVARQCSGRESNLGPAHRECSALTTTPLSHLLRLCGRIRIYATLLIAAHTNMSNFYCTARKYVELNLLQHFTISHTCKVLNLNMLL